MDTFEGGRSTRQTPSYRLHASNPLHGPKQPDRPKEITAVATSTKRSRRKERNQANAKARSNSIRNNRIKQMAILLVIAAVIIGIALVAINTVSPLEGTQIGHGGQ
jgi:hypothetical protein